MCVSFDGECMLLSWLLPLYIIVDNICMSCSTRYSNEQIHKLWKHIWDNFDGRLSMKLPLSAPNRDVINNMESTACQRLPHNNVFYMLTACFSSIFPGKLICLSHDIVCFTSFFKIACFTSFLNYVPGQLRLTAPTTGHFCNEDLEKLSSLQKWPVLDAVSLICPGT